MLALSKSIHALSTLGFEEPMNLGIESNRNSEEATIVLISYLTNEGFEDSRVQGFKRKEG